MLLWWAQGMDHFAGIPKRTNYRQQKARHKGNTLCFHIQSLITEISFFTIYVIKTVCLRRLLNNKQEQSTMTTGITLTRGSNRNFIFNSIFLQIFKRRVIMEWKLTWGMYLHSAKIFLISGIFRYVKLLNKKAEQAYIRQWWLTR